MHSTKLKNEYESLKNTLMQVPIKARLYLSLLIAARYDSYPVSVPKTIQENYASFVRAFKQLNHSQQHAMISNCLTAIQQFIHQQSIPQAAPIFEIETSCELKGSMLSMTTWQQRSFRFDYPSRQVRIGSGKKQILLQLNNWLVRQSKCDKEAMVFEPIEHREKTAKITVKFKNSSIKEQIYRCVLATINQICFKRVEILMKQDALQSVQTKKEVSEYKGFTFLSQKNINQYFAVKEKKVQKLNINRIKATLVYSQTDIKIFKSSSNKYYYLQMAHLPQCDSLLTAKNSTVILKYDTIPGAYHCQKLQSFANSIAANYYKLASRKQEYELVMLVQRQEKEGKYQQYMHAINQMGSSLQISFIVVQIFKFNGRYYSHISLNTTHSQKQNANQICKLMLQMIDESNELSVILQQQTSGIDLTSKAEQSSIAQYQSRMHQQSNIDDINFNKRWPIRSSQNSYQDSSSNSADNKNSKHSVSFHSQDQNFYTVREEDENFYTIREADFEDSPTQTKKNTKNDKNSKKIISNSAYVTKSYMNERALQIPRAKGDEERISEHFMFTDWKKGSKGGVVCDNEQVINEQKKVFRVILGQLGNKFMKMKGLMNFSLPIFICKPQSALQTICRNLTYAPLLFQQNNNQIPLQRIKNVAVFQISMAALALSMKKPLNPILGETYQGEIDGCPVYGEQVCHHPAITYVMMIGRGYKIYGSVSPQISIRLNYVTAPNYTFLTVQFDNGDKIDFSLPTMVINGMLFGQRSIYFEGTNYVIDYKNNLIVQIVYNSKNQGGMFSLKSKEAPDYLAAQIYQVHPAFMQKFIASGKKLSPKKDEKNKLLRSFGGEWNSKLLMNGETLFDFEKTLPFVLKSGELNLPSDCSFRADLNQLLNKNIVKAQQAKDQMEELQRADKKKRQAHQ